MRIYWYIQLIVSFFKVTAYFRMMPSGATPLDSRLRSQTETYLNTVAACVDLLPQLIENYSSGDGYQETANEICTLESECDERNQEISSLLSNATVEQIGLRNTHIDFNLEQILRMYQKIDEVANTAEQIAEQLVTMKPPRREPHIQKFQELATCATKASDVLRDVVSTFARALCNPNQTTTVTDEIKKIRTLESSCDKLRNDLIENAFADNSIDQPLVYREFALLFDRLVDTIEDVTDQIVLISSTESWISTEDTLEQ